MPASSALEAEAIAFFRETFRADAQVVSAAPARVELLGNHTDYNGGLVLASAIDRVTVVAGRPIAGRVARVRSRDFAGEAVFLIDAPERGEPGSWGRYVRGIVWAMQAAYGELESGFEAVILGQVPLGAGLSSSASLEASLGLFLVAAGLLPGQDDLLDLANPGRMELAQTLRRAENEFVGVASGLLDQFCSLYGREHRALFLDCRSLAHDSVDLGDPAPSIVVCDTKTSRRLADGMYNVRRQECESIVAAIHERRPADAPKQLRDVDLGELESHWDSLDEVARKRARHILTENDRVRAGFEALQQGDVIRFGHLISQSHISSRDDFENSSAALDAMVEAAQEAPGFLGGKLSGAGWAGCTVNLVEAGKAPDFAEAVAAGYKKRTGTTAEVHICHAADGASARYLS